MPSLLKLIGNQNISWTSINSGLENHLQKLKTKLEASEGDTIQKEVTFYSFIVGNLQGKKETAPMFDFFEKTFSQLNERLSKDEAIHVHKMVKSVLTNFDYQYLNFIGELATLNAYKSTGKYSLINIEEKIYLQKGVQADLFMRRNSDKKEFFVEIVNIHLQNKDLNTSPDIKLRIESKIKEKIEKTFFESPKRALYIQPIIWYDDEKQLKIVAELYQREEIKIKNVYAPMCYVSFQHNNGSFEPRFEYVTTILNDKPKNSWLKRIESWISNKKN